MQQAVRRTATSCCHYVHLLKRRMSNSSVARLTLWKCLRVALLAARWARTQARPPSRSCRAPQRGMARPWGWLEKLTRRSAPPAGKGRRAAAGGVQESSSGQRAPCQVLYLDGTTAETRHSTVLAKAAATVKHKRRPACHTPRVACANRTLHVLQHCKQRT